VVPRRYRGRHLKRRPVRRGPVVVGTAAAVWAAAPGARGATHSVAPGETLSAIAQRYGTSVQALVEANQLADPDLIVSGQRLRIPGRARVASIHVVRSGETLSGIAARYGTTAEALARANRLKDVDLIVAGARLKVPVQPAPSDASGASGIELAIEREARSRGLDSSLVKAVAWHESGWHQDVTSERGAVGVMQVMPGTARYVNGYLGGGRLDLEKARDNVRLGVIYLDHLLEAMPSRRKALAAYLSGPGAVGRRLKGYQRDYVRTVKALKPRF
jgi:soluble lytic murein transglycosylase-like protein